MVLAVRVPCGDVLHGVGVIVAGVGRAAPHAEFCGTFGRSLVAAGRGIREPTCFGPDCDDRLASGMEVGLRLLPLKSCSAFEVASIHEGALHCSDVDVERQCPDAHGGFNGGTVLDHMLGFQLMPRLKITRFARLHRPAAGQDENRGGPPHDRLDHGHAPSTGRR
ncbi:Tn3 family transposase [Streptomyces sp. NBC_01013]|uniref:Tn3 family transposase n=1 Tax=Streptomyces sp. NBC_01013 TaxID=2903718 RepID=UPI00386DB895|nr:transposase [Streptomyces sp. NBC_01013]